MTAAVGLPTLRLIRIAIGPFALATHPLFPGEWRQVSPAMLELPERNIAAAEHSASTASGRKKRRR